MPGIGRQTFQAIRNQAAKGNNILVLPDQNARFRRFFYKFRRLTCPASRLRQIVPTFQLLPQCRLHFQRLFNSFFNRRLIKLAFVIVVNRFSVTRWLTSSATARPSSPKPCRHRADTLRHPHKQILALPPHPAAYRRHRPPYSPCIRRFLTLITKHFLIHCSLLLSHLSCLRYNLHFA